MVLQKSTSSQRGSLFCFFAVQVFSWARKTPALKVHSLKKVNVQMGRFGALARRVFGLVHAVERPARARAVF